MFLVGRYLAIEPEDLQTFLSARLTSGEIRELAEFIRKRIEDRVPVPYLVREAWQGGYRFCVDERVLIPRSYIADLLTGQIQQFAGPSWKPKKILDLGTGSGALAILAAHAFPTAAVDAVDISPDALQVAAENVSLHHLTDRVRLIESDIFDNIPSRRYDLILANPPYEPRDVVDSMPPELAHEPRSALLGGEDGMDCVHRIMRQSRCHLSRTGILILELGELRVRIESEYPDCRAHSFALADGTDAVMGFRARNLPLDGRSSSVDRPG